MSSTRRFVLSLAFLPVMMAGQSRRQPEGLQAYREKIDAVDQRIVELLSERARIVQDVGRLKRKAQMPVRAPGREKEIYQRLAKINPGPLPNDSVERIYRAIFAEMVRLEVPIAEGDSKR
jgi:chorismate mutase/prephenate dehydratase